MAEDEDLEAEEEDLEVEEKGEDEEEEETSMPKWRLHWMKRLPDHLQCR